MIDHLPKQERSALWCSPGLGKTGVCLHYVNDLLTSGRSDGVLIIAPIRVCATTWPDQVENWDHSSWMKVANLRHKDGIKAWEEGSADIYLINPEMLPKIVAKLIKGRKKLPVDTLIIDEISLASNPTSKRFNSIRPHLKHFARRVGLTGTPVPNSHLDVFAQTRLLDDGERFGTSFYKFRSEYFESDYMGFKWTLRKGAKEAIDAKLSDLCLVMLGDDWLDVPECSTIDVDVSLPPDALKMYRTMEKDLLVQFDKADVEAMSAAVLVGKLLQFSSGSVYDENKDVRVIHDAKTKALLKIRKDLKNEPILVLVNYIHEKERLLRDIPGAELFDEKRLADWKAGKIKTWIANPRSLSHGIDGLQHGGRTIVWYTPTYSWQDYTQTNARLVRTGQSSETRVYRLLGSGTIDHAVIEAIRAKGENESGLMQAVKNLRRLRDF